MSWLWFPSLSESNNNNENYSFWFWFQFKLRIKYFGRYCHFEPRSNSFQFQFRIQLRTKHILIIQKDEEVYKKCGNECCKNVKNECFTTESDWWNKLVAISWFQHLNEIYEWPFTSLAKEKGKLAGVGLQRMRHGKDHQLCFYWQDFEDHFI